MTISLQELVDGTKDLQALPSTTLQLMRLLDDDTVEADEVLAVIGKDPSLTSNLLKLCNSSYYGLRRKVASAREALILLGNKTIVTLAFATSMGDVLRGPLSAYRLDRNMLWHHALGTALGAGYLVEATGGKGQKEVAFTAGLVHDIGKLILNRPLKNGMDIMAEDCDFQCLLEAESSTLGFDHAEAGAVLGEAWNFPAALVDIIRFHHRPLETEENPDLVRAVAAANLVTCYLGYGGGTGPVQDDDIWPILRELEYEEETILALIERLPGDMNEMLGVIGESL
jgi:putative nucleotidyltransferase with HDIG domain